MGGDDAEAEAGDQAEIQKELPRLPRRGGQGRPAPEAVLLNLPALS